MTFLGIIFSLLLIIGLVGMFGEPFDIFNPYEKVSKFTKLFFFTVVFVIIGWLAYHMYIINTTPVILPSR